jgi:cold shock CspA family protein
MSSEQSQKLVGIVKWFDSRGGFGFITVLPEQPESNKDIFVHYSSLNVEHSHYKYLVLGEYVEFLLEPSKNEKYEFSAKNVSGIRGGNLMCESRRLSTLETNELKEKKHETKNYETAKPREPTTKKQHYGQSDNGDFLKVVKKHKLSK